MEKKKKAFKTKAEQQRKHAGISAGKKLVAADCKAAVCDESPFSVARDEVDLRIMRRLFWHRMPRGI